MKNDELGQSHLFSSNTKTEHIDSNDDKSTLSKDKLPDIRADQALKVIFSNKVE